MRISKSLLILFCCLISSAQAADISITGNWSEMINETDLTAGAGSDLRSPIESGSTLATLDITAWFNLQGIRVTLWTAHNGDYSLFFNILKIFGPRKVLP